MSSPTTTSPVRAAQPELRRWRPPAVQVVPGPLAAADLDGCDVLAVPVAPGAGEGAAVEPRPGAADAAVRYGADLAALCAAEDVSGEAGRSARLPVPAPDGSPRRLLVLGVGDSSPAALRRAAAALARAAGPGTDVATTLADGAGPDGVRAVVEGFLLASHVPPLAGRRAGAEPAPRRLLLVGDVDAAAVARGEALAAATALARDLAATPSNLKDPAWVVAQARATAAAHGLTVKVREEAQLRREGFGGLLAVGGGSPSAPALAEVRYRPRGRAAAGAPHVVIAGKGITYDTGGLALKPRESMVPMKTDMTGAAVVLAVVAAAARLKLPVRVTGLLALAENAFGGSSYRPGDVVRHYGGRTTEVNNTDAEGRLVLGDALAYADATLDPDVLVDVATLTGAASVALGKRHAALFASDDALAAQLTAASQASGERVWRLPLVPEYAELLRSDLADARQVASTPGAGAGTILAAQFLQPFTGGRRWAHLDIAGPGRSDAPEHEVGRGATGFGARLLVRWLESLAA
ncbi:leucyl aminopeptidase family protein [Kineococcus sp. SYSU DK005]|uniref:leucyl aminopeptidase family protein n=1 Tax=Kineococcus sp. SYSU DK005 TaxID=3383126 RepID=UPI003D7DFC72